MTLNQCLADAGLPERRPALSTGGGSLAAKPLYQSPAVHRSRALRLPTVFADLTPQQKTRVLHRVLEHCTEETLNRWARRDLSAARWGRVKDAYFTYICGTQRTAVGR